MTSRKRDRLPPDTPRKRTKTSATAPIVVEDDDDLESILAQIKAQEESETLAKKLQDEWNAPGPSTSGVHASGAKHTSEVIDITDDNVPPEDDEAMARRLARQWELEDEDVVVFDATQSQSPPLSSTLSHKGKAKCADVTPLPPVAKLEQCRDLFVGNKICSCGATLPSPRGHVVFTPQLPPPSLLRLLHVPCKKCQTNHCRGCISPLSCPLSCKGKGANLECSVETCCDKVRVIAIFETLGGFDKQYLGERETSDQRAREAAARARQSQVGSVGPGGTGYGMDGLASYSSFHQRARRGRGSRTARDSTHSPLLSHFDEIIVRALKTVTGYLPSPYVDDPQIYDMLPHESIDSLLALSQLPDLLDNLLRNDSVTDWIARIDIYHAMLALLRRMADCELTLEVLIGSRWGTTESCGLEDYMWGDGQIIWERTEDTNAYAQTQPLYAHFKKLTRQCEAFLTGASSMLQSDAGDGEVAETALKATSLCGDIIAARDDIERAMTVMGKDPAADIRTPDSSECPHDSSSIREKKSRSKGKERDPAIDMERKYALECERLAFKYVSLSRPNKKGAGLEYPDYNYASELNKTAHATRNPKDRLHLVKELAVMATSLPPGVWVRVDEVRNDAIKIMIAGPEGTPYAGGLFEFDCFIPIEYPNKPPLMHLRTTGGGSVRFNPNLYNNGKVCLSLLGTWPGRPEEQWSPKSTLLQVLVSIQSMILIDLPYFNEPGFGQANPTDLRSVAYNKNICLQTTRWAIVDWLKDAQKDTIWGEVIASHFITRHDVIKPCIQNWAKANPGIRNYEKMGAGLPISSSAMGSVFASLPGPPPSLLPDYPPISNMQALPSGHASQHQHANIPDVGGGSLLDLMESAMDASVDEDAWGEPSGMSTATAPGTNSRSRQGKKTASRAAPPKAQKGKGMDLLDEFEQGIARVRKWVFGEADGESESEV